MSQRNHLILYSDSNLNTPGLRHVYPSISITGAMLTSVAVPMPASGRLHTLGVRQRTGSNNASIKLFCSSRPFPTGEDAVAATADEPEVLYQVIAPQAYTAGTDLFYTNDLGRPYTNADSKTGAFSNNSLHLVIVPTGAAGTTVWDVVIVASQDSPG